MSSQDPAFSAPSAASTSKLSRSRDVLALLGVSFYAIFTLLPDSSTLTVSWPWVFIWQVALALPWIWLLRQWWRQDRVLPLGFGLDYGVSLMVVGLALSTAFAEFPQQARWYCWAAICGIAALYALNDWMNSRHQHLLNLQGGLSVAFIGVSLWLWSTQTLAPELQRLQGLRQLGLQVFYDFSVLELRNWAPIGHQNYVAGYLVLSLPLLVGLSLTAKSPWRCLWGAGTVLGIIDLYTSSSRGGWLGLGAAGLCGIALWAGQSRIPVRWRWAAGLGFIGILASLMATNNRLRSLFSLEPSAAGGELAFRLITNATGWAIGAKHPLWGAGLGSVPLLDQAFRPEWAGGEAELVFQLHSTPAQLWAELGLWGIVLGMVLSGWLGVLGLKLWRSIPTSAQESRILCGSLMAGLLGYGVMSFTDYQLDVVCISGTLVVYLSSLLFFLRQYVSPIAPIQIPLRWFRWGAVGLLLAVGVWLTPIHRAWQLSSLGFNAIPTKSFNAQAVQTFSTNLQKAHQLAPWEPYYSAELGYNLAQAGLANPDAQAASQLIKQSVVAFEQTVAASPYQEFGYSSLGWLQLITQQVQPAMKSFLGATRLAPAKRGTFYSLGLSLLEQHQEALAVEAMTLEVLRNPLWMTSPVWRSPRLAATAVKVQANVSQVYKQLIAQSKNSALTAYLQQCLGGIHWWQGNFTEAAKEWNKNGSPLSQQLLTLAQHQSLSQNALAQPQTAGAMMIKAWLDPQQRPKWVSQALLTATQAPPNPVQVQTILAGMARAKSLDEWIKVQAPVASYRRERAGFGVLSRHIDGPAPQDFFEVVDNTAMTTFFSELMPTLDYSPPLDQALQPLRMKLWQKIDAL